MLRIYKDEEFDPLWRRSVTLYQEFAGAMISAGQYNRGFALAHEGMVRHDRDVKLRYQCALALARMGVVAKADGYVRDLLHVPDAKLKADALTLAGRLQKDRYVRAEHARHPERKRAMGPIAAEAAKLYKSAYELSPQYFPAINAATMFMLAGDAARARDLANATLALASAQHDGESDYWLLASRGEALLIRNQWDEAARCYQEAVRLCGGRMGDLASMRRNIRLLHQRVGVPESVLSLFRLGSVMAFAGEMADNPFEPAGARARPPLHPALEEAVAEEIRGRLESRNVTVGYFCPRAGCDILFAEELLRRGSEVHLVLPFNLDDFYDRCVSFGVGEQSRWHKRCQDLIDRAGDAARGRVTVHYATTERYMNDNVLFDFLHAFTQGLAITQAAQLGVTPEGLVVFDPAAAEAYPGNCAQFLDLWKKTGWPGGVIDLRELRDRVPAAGPGGGDRDSAVCPPQAADAGLTEGRELKAILFADMKNFSSLSDEESPMFFLVFTREVKAAIDQSPRPPVFCNTWGDGLYAVFDAVRDAADFAVRLLERMEAVNWREQGLPAEMSVRIGMHVGPVYRRADPILGRDNFYGSHVNRAARIEPVTTPGCAFVSEQFAATLALDPTSDFVCTRVGIERLAKGYDTCPVYNLGRG